MNTDAVVAFGSALVALALFRRRSNACKLLDIEQLERVPKSYRCVVCGCTVLYLDAAVGQLRCAKCDTVRGQSASAELQVRKGKYGRNDLGSGAWVEEYVLRMCSPSKMTPPDVLFLVLGHPAQSVSE